MVVTGVDVFMVPPQWLFVKVTTDADIVGWGEAGVGTWRRTAAAAISDLGRHLVGKDPLRIEDHWQILSKARFFRGGPILGSAVGALDIALWDIAGKARGASIHELLGGPVRDRISVYGWVGGADMGDCSAEELADEAIRKTAAGCEGVKLVVSPLRPIDTPAAVDEIVERFAAVRAAVGKGRSVALDCHGRCSKTMARVLIKELEEFQPMWVEEPVLPEFPEALANLARAGTVPIATGERLYSRWEVKEVLTTGIAVIQPDPALAGGISEVHRIAAMAEAYDVGVALHSASGPIALAACLQLDFAVRGALIQEQGVDYDWMREGLPPYRLTDYVINKSVFRFDEGYIRRPLGPGLGIEVDEDAVRAAAADPDQPSSGEWAPRRSGDGSLAEW